MQHTDTISVHDREASQYDQQIHAYNSHGHDALFGMSFEYVNAHDRLLDIGIGAGLASRSFAKMGLNVFGCDGSPEMLKVCESKAFTEELKVFDLRNLPLPYADRFFDHVVCCGVLHFFGDLDAIFKEVLRMIKPKGVFAFTVAAQSTGEEATTNDHEPGFIKRPTPWGVPIYKHSRKYMIHLLRANGFDILKIQKLLIRGGPGEGSEDMVFSAHIAMTPDNVKAGLK